MNIHNLFTKTYRRTNPIDKEKYLKIYLQIKSSEHRNPQVYAILMHSRAVILLFLKNH